MATAGIVLSTVKFAQKRTPRIYDVDLPETRYAWNGGTSLAYQVVGDGPVDLLYMQGYSSHVDMNWESPYLTRFLRGLARDARLVITDRRGWGCSERFSPDDIPDVDAFTDDVLAVMDGIGSTRCAIFASFECSIVATLFAASYPERTAALILVDPLVTYCPTEETPWMPTVMQWEEVIEDVRAQWGTSAWTHEYLGLSDTPEGNWFRRYLRASMTPGSLAAEVRRYLNVDIRAVLPTVQVPTLVLSDHEGEFEVKPETGRFIAARIPGARFVEHSSAGGLHRLHWYARGDAIVEEVGRFLAQLLKEEAAFERVLATVLFTDIVRSTETATKLGDHSWGDLLRRHHSTIRVLLARYRGKEIDTAGDGFFACFDGPARAVRCALAIVEAMKPLGLEVRAGVHTGEVEIDNGKPGGIAVVIGARIAGRAGASEVLASRTVRDLVAGSGLVFEDQGEHELKGVREPWRLYKVSV